MTWLSSLALLLAASSPSAQTSALKAASGVNLSGCEFDAAGTLCPNPDDADWYLGQGFKVIRLPFRSTIDPARLHRIVDHIVARRGYVILDRHEFNWPAPADQVRFWSAMAGRYRGNDHVLIDVMNEPRGIGRATGANPWMQWAKDANTILAGLRDAGFRNVVLLEWPGYSAAFRFDKHEPPKKACESAVCALDRSGGLHDPIGKTLLSPHLYFDRGSSGGSAQCGNTLNLDKARIPAAQRGYRLFLGESAFGNAYRLSPACAAIGAAALAEIRNHPETWAGVTWWGGGRVWKENYLFKIEPRKGTRATAPISPYLRMLTGH